MALPPRSRGRRLLSEGFRHLLDVVGTHDYAVVRGVVGEIHVHRDITPGNVLVSRESPFAVKLGDFGLAGRVHPETRILRAAGTIRYLPPEAALGFATELGDLYAVALLMYEALTGAAAFPLIAHSGSTAAQLRFDLLEAKKKLRLPPSYLRPDVPKPVDEMLMRSLDPEPTKRFRSALEFLTAARALMGEPALR